MKTIMVGLQDNVSPTYNKFATTVAGLMSQKTLAAPYDSGPVVGTPFPKFIDVQTDTAPGGAVLAGMMCQTTNNRLFILQATPATGVANFILLYNFDLSTGAYSYVGKIAFAVTAATIVGKGFKVDDSNPSNVKIFIGHTSTVVTTGGVMMINKVQIAHFAPSGGVVYYAAQSNDAVGSYYLQLPNEVGGATLLTTFAGMSCPKAAGSTDANINTKLYAHNGISATHQMYAFDYSIAPQLASLGTSTVTAGNTTGASTTFTMAGNTLAVNDAVIITSNAPTGYTNSVAGAVQTMYFVVATNFVAGSTFSLSATLGGAIVSASTVSTTATFVRAFGQCTNLAIGKTPNATSLGGGTLLLTNTEKMMTPATGSNANQACIFMATTTNYHQVRISELFYQQTGTTNGTINVTGLSDTSGMLVGQTVFGAGIPVSATIASIVSPTAITLSVAATTSTTQTLTFGNGTWTSLQSVNVVGTGLDFVAPVPVCATFSTLIDRVVALDASSVFYVKKFMNSVIESWFGGAARVYMEAQNHLTDPPQLAAITQIETRNGWIFMASSATTGQRGIIAFDMRSDATFDISYVISPLIPTAGLTLRGLQTIEEAYDYTGVGDFEYRTSADQSDAIFSNAVSGWSSVNTAADLSIPLSNYTQIKMRPIVLGPVGSLNEAVSVPLQLRDIKLDVDTAVEISDYWDYSQNDSDSAIPTKVGFALALSYLSGIVPRMKLVVKDTANTIIGTFDTVTNAAQFKYSTDGGLTWNALGTIPNTPDTRVQFTFLTPPGVDVRVAWMEY